MDSIINDKMVVFHNNSAVAVCAPDYLGFMGVYLKNIFLRYPVGTRLDVGYITNDTKASDEYRVQMVINKTNIDGTGLRLSSFEKESIDKWRKLLLLDKEQLATNELQ